MNQDVLTTAFMYGMLSYIYHQNQANVGTIPVPCFFLSWEWDFFIAKKVTMLQKSPCFLGSKSQLGPPKEWSNRLDNHGTLGPFLDRRWLRVSRVVFIKKGVIQT